MLVEYLTGEEGGVDEQVSAAQISRLIIAGNSLAPMSVNVKEEPFTNKEERKPVRYHNHRLPIPSDVSHRDSEDTVMMQLHSHRTQR